MRETADPSLYDRADAAFVKAAALIPDDDLITVGRAQLAASRHEFADALRLARQALGHLPGFEDAILIEVDALVELGRYDEAFRTIETQAARDPDLPTLSRLSYARELRGDMPGAIKAMQDAIGAGTPTPEGAAYVTALLGDLYARTGNVDAARDAYERALALVPSHPPSLIGMGRLALRAGDMSTGIDHLQQAVDVLPLPEAVVLLGEAQQVAGDEEAAESSFALVRAELQLAQASNVVVDLELARFEADHGDASRSLELANATWNVRPTVFAADAVGWALHRIGRDTEARNWSTKGLRLGTRDPLLHFHAGAIDAALGDVKAARRELELALQLDPAFSPTGAREARELLDRLVG